MSLHLRAVLLDLLILIGIKSVQEEHTEQVVELSMNDQVSAHEDLVWHTCYDNFKCSRLRVPMDWHETSSEKDKTVELALVKVEATVPVTDRRYGGAVVLNPGILRRLSVKL